MFEKPYEIKQISGKKWRGGHTPPGPPCSYGPEGCTFRSCTGDGEGLISCTKNVLDSSQSRGYHNLKVSKCRFSGDWTTISLFLLTPKKFRIFSQFCGFYNNNDNCSDNYYGGRLLGGGGTQILPFIRRMSNLNLPSGEDFAKYWLSKQFFLLK